MEHIIDSPHVERAERLRELALSVFPNRSVVVGVHGGEREGFLNYTIAIDIEDANVTFAQLTALASVLGTDQIDIVPAEEGRAWSAETYESGTPASILARVSPASASLSGL